MGNYEYDEVKSNVLAGGTTVTIQDWDKWETKERMLLKLSIKDLWKTLKDLYEVKKTNWLLFLKRKILSIKMEKNETIVAFILRIKELKKNLGDISEVVSDT